MQAFIARMRHKIASHPLPALFIVFLIVQLVLYFQIGVFTGLEAEKYVGEGKLLYEAGKISEPKYFFYLPVILLVYLCLFLGISFKLIVIVQVILSWIAIRCFFRTGQKTGNLKIAFISTILLILFFPIQAWNFYLYSDSIFISLSIIYVYILCSNNSNNYKSLTLIILWLTVLIFSRPNGMLLIPPTIVYLLLRTQSKKQLLLSSFVSLTLIALLYYLLFFAFTGGGDLNAMKPFIEEHVICFVPLNPGGASLDIVKTSNPVNDLFYYITHNPSHFFGLMGKKLLSFFNLTRPYYSSLHNIYLFVLIIPIYILSIPGIYIIKKRARDFAIFIIALIVLYPLAISFQCDDWHSRFTMVVFPYFILLSCMGLFAIISGRRQKQHSR